MTTFHATISDGGDIGIYGDADAAIDAIAAWARTQWHDEMLALRCERLMADRNVDDDRTDEEILAEVGDLTAAWISETGEQTPDLRTVDATKQADALATNNDWHAMATRELIDDDDDTTEWVVPMTFRHVGIVSRTT